MVRCSPHHSRSVILAEAIEYARPFDQNLGSPLIYFFYLHTTIRLKYMVLFHLIFLLCTTIRPRLRVLTDLFLLFTHDHSAKMYRPLSFILSFVYDHSTKIRVLIDLFLLIVNDHLTKLYGTLSFIFSLFCARPFDQKLGSSFYLYSTIRPKFRALID